MPDLETTMPAESPTVVRIHSMSTPDPELSVITVVVDPVENRVVVHVPEQEQMLQITVAEAWAVWATLSDALGADEQPPEWVAALSSVTYGTRSSEADEPPF
ncbi:hypothetical protein [Nonomuraea sp. NPDC050310]|uniref:hypothetical protein n=1 Tax=Nonomuraea sp. NPDC050310 TaxID=3154935 RepID=UPI0033DB75F7